MHDRQPRPTPIFTTSGDWGGLLVHPYIFNTGGEWVGWIAQENKVYDVDGVYVGWLTRDNRILRKRYTSDLVERQSVPADPGRIRAPATIPLPPMMPELPPGVVDVLEEFPYRLHTTDTGDLREDMD